MANNIMDEFFLKDHQERLQVEHDGMWETKYIRRHGYHPELSTLAYEGGRLGEYPKRYMEIKGNVVKIRNIQKSPRKKNTLRKDISEFSIKSRRRFMETLKTIDWDAINTERIMEITLTYHSAPNSGNKVKEHLHALRKNILDRYPGSVLIWKLEFQMRGAPHYHLIMICLKQVDLGDYMYKNEQELSFYDREEKAHKETGVKGFRAYIQHRWNIILDEDDQHFNSGIQIDQVRNPQGLPHYLTNYIAKERKADSHKEKQHKVPEWYTDVGRFWGIYNRKLLKIKHRRFIISEPTYEAVEKYFRDQWKEKGLPDYKGHEYGLNYYARSKKEIDKEVMNILIDNEELMN